MEKLVNLLRENNLNIGSAESLTGGLFSSNIVSISGSSDVYLGSIISYANNIKRDLLHIDQSIIDKYGVVSGEVAYLMSENASKLLNSDITVSFTGNAGPNVLEDKSVGSVYTCIKYKNEYYNYYDQLNGSRNEIRAEIVEIVKDRLIQLISEKGK